MRTGYVLELGTMSGEACFIDSIPAPGCKWYVLAAAAIGFDLEIYASLIALWHAQVAAN